MPRHCCVPNCKSNYSSTLKKEEPKSTFVFPKDDELKEKWLKAVSRKNWEPSKSSVVCSVHFKQGDIIALVRTVSPDGTLNDSPCKPKLIENAVPSIFPAVVQVNPTGHQEKYSCKKSHEFTETSARSFSSGTVICRLCLEPASKGNISLTTLDIYQTKSEAFKIKQATEIEQFAKMIRTLMPTFDFGLVYNPIMCHVCSKQLELAFRFVEATMKSQRTIEAYQKRYVKNKEMVICADVVKYKDESSGSDPPKKKKKLSRKTTDPDNYHKSYQDYEDDMKDYLVPTDELTNIVNKEPVCRIEENGVKIEVDPIGVDNFSQLQLPGSHDSECRTVKSEVFDNEEFCFFPNFENNQNVDVYNNSDIVSSTSEVKLKKNNSCPAEGS